jgi:hypothetical protein
LVVTDVLDPEDGGSRLLDYSDPEVGSSKLLNYSDPEEGGSDSLLLHVSNYHST